MLPSNLDEFKQDGVALYTPIGGYSGISTRTEPAAAIIAISAHGPIHLGTDSKAFATRANWLLELVALKSKPKRKLNLMTDGDLWEHFNNVIMAKGARSIKISWVKGHATEEHIRALHPS